MTDSCFKDFHIFKYNCMYDFELTSFRKIEINTSTIGRRIMNLHDINQKLTVARQNGFVFNQIN